MDTRPLYMRKRVWFGAFTAFTLGAVVATTGSHDATATTKSAPAPTVRVTATVTATPHPRVTVTKTAKPKPAPTVTVTKTADTYSDTGSGSSSSDTGTCSIVSNSGNCYSAGEFCRNSDHGAATTDASGTPITCSPSGSRWRWTY